MVKGINWSNSRPKVLDPNTGSTCGIHTGADEISRAADHHSRRSEQQAASLEETAAALDDGEAPSTDE